MTPHLDYLYALGEARSCLAALAALAGDDDESADFERLLIYLDVITDDVGPATWPIVATRAALFARLESALRRLAETSPPAAAPAGPAESAAPWTPAPELREKGDQEGGSERGC